MKEEDTALVILVQCAVKSTKRCYTIHAGVATQSGTLVTGPIYILYITILSLEENRVLRVEETIRKAMCCELIQLSWN